MLTGARAECVKCGCQDLEVSPDMRRLCGTSTTVPGWGPSALSGRVPEWLVVHRQSAPQHVVAAVAYGCFVVGMIPYRRKILNETEIKTSRPIYTVKL